MSTPPPPPPPQDVLLKPGLHLFMLGDRLQKKWARVLPVVQPCGAQGQSA